MTTMTKTATEKTATGLPIISFWRTVVALIFAAGLYSMYARFALGFQAATNLTDPQPWGLWVGLGTLCGVGLSAGGFAIAASVISWALNATGRSCARRCSFHSWDIARCASA